MELKETNKSLCAACARERGCELRRGARAKPNRVTVECAQYAPAAAQVIIAEVGRLLRVPVLFTLCTGLLALLNDAKGGDSRVTAVSGLLCLGGAVVILAALRYALAMARRIPGADKEGGDDRG